MSVLGLFKGKGKQTSISLGDIKRVRLSPSLDAGDLEKALRDAAIQADLGIFIEREHQDGFVLGEGGLNEDEGYSGTKVRLVYPSGGDGVVAEFGFYASKVLNVDELKAREGYFSNPDFRRYLEVLGAKIGEYRLAGAET